MEYPSIVTTLLQRRTLLGAALGALPLLGAAQSAADAVALLKALQAGGLVLYFRHGATNKGGVDRIEWPRERQRLLSAEGEAQARAVGAAFQRHGLRTGEVLASPFARCHDFAQIAFGRVQDDRQLIGLLSQDSGRQQRIEHSLTLLRRPVPPGELRVMVGHGSNIQETTGVLLPESGCVLTRPDAAAERGFSVLGPLQPDDWRALARG